ncbi:MAG: PD40 domain-containing protein [Bacteroidetes bacterium]|nr:PD40 domain-containing protein [Bacteroidota bacterium]
MRLYRKHYLIAALLGTMLHTHGHLHAQSQNFSFDPEKNIAGKPYFADPGISPDGSTIAFSSGGDIWTVPSSGGEARLLIAHPAFETRPLYSPDGKWLAFNSNRTGNGDIYLLNLATSELKRLTSDDGNEDVSGWSPDSKYVYFSTASHDINAMRDVYRVRIDGGTPMPVSHSRYMTEFWAAPAPDGKAVAFDARGVASSQWWRNGHSHLDESEIWLWNPGTGDGSFERLTEGGAKDLWPMWSKDGGTLYFISDRTGAENLWSMPLHGKAKQLTSFSKGRVLWPSISTNGQTIVFERNFSIWKYDISSGKSTEVNIKRMGQPSPGLPATAGGEAGRRGGGMKLSPDGKKIAFINHGEIFVGAATGGEAMRVTFTGAVESQLTWSPNSNAISYVSDRDETSHVYEYNFLTNKETRLTSAPKDDWTPVYSPDGKSLTFVRDNKELIMLDRATGKETIQAKAYIGRAPNGGTVIRYSPDGKWIAFGATGPKGFRNIYVIPSTGGEARPVSFLANSNGGDISWGDDGKYILFTTGQRTEIRNIARVDLTAKKPEFNEDRLQRLFVEQNTSPSTPVNPSEPTPTAPAPTPADTTTRTRTGGRRGTPRTEIDFKGIHERLSILALGGADVNDVIVNKEGVVVISASIGGQTNLYLYSSPEGGRGGGRGAAPGGAGSPLRPLTTTPGMKSDIQFGPDGKEVFYMSQGGIESISLDTKTVKPVSIRSDLQPDFDKEKIEAFRQAWTAQKRGYADPDMNGVDWNAVFKEFQPIVAGVASTDELRRVLSMMVGELNSSHSGVSGPGAFTPAPTGRLGLSFDRAEYEDHGKLKVTEVIESGPADLSGLIHVGDYLTTVNGTPLTNHDNLDQVLEEKVGRKINLTISTAAGTTTTVTIKPINLATEKGLLYKQWVRQEREYIAKISNGRLGYVHMNDMSEESLNQLYLDLDAENQNKEGVVVDVRANNGGFVNPYALDVLTRKSYLTMINRGLPGAPARAQLGQRSLELPTILLTNQHSLSDAEDFTEGYRTMKLGTVVGEPTGGWIIFTGSVSLIDGSAVRMPGSKILDHEGKVMEMHPRPVDIPISNPIGHAPTSDPQADAAVKELLKQIDAAKK